MYKRQLYVMTPHAFAQGTVTIYLPGEEQTLSVGPVENVVQLLSLIHISEPTRPY
ncbi:hypothetical protein PVA38_11055 [Streptococcus pneumoniae D39]|nr:hypothetical protein PVA38_11055 [Streptococcus pneumoniae D39]